MNKKYLYAFVIFATLSFLLTGCSNNNTKTNENDSTGTRLNSEININTTNTITSDQQNTVNEIHLGRHDIENEENKNNTIPKEEELASFSTKLVGRNTPRTRNIGITTKKLNGTIVKNEETFSFCGLIGKPTADMGYEEADSFDKNGNTVKTLGGGNCQVSSTLYNAVLQVNELKVVERHPHTKDVHYVDKGKDAAVSHGSVDFKFKNNTGNSVKIYADSDLNNVNIKIVKITEE